jgi:Predicted choline kinase involved in LPS biosynthesis
MPSEIEREVIAHRATTVLRRTWEGVFHLEQPTLVSDRDRNQVFRCRVQGEGTFPLSIIIKWIKDPLDTARGLTDWASLAFLSQIADSGSVAPRLFGGDAEHRLFVMEDLGEEGSLEHLLLSPDSSRATTMLCALARQMGTLHATTMGKESLFQRLCENLSLATVSSRFREAEQWLEDCQKVEDWCCELEYVPPTGFEQACTHIAHTFAHPGDFLAFTHGDPAPSNNHLSGSKIYLVDFEYAGYRHALYDLTGWNILCPLPKACVRLMSHHLRIALAPACEASGDDEIYQSACAILCTYRAMALLSWMPLRLIEHNESWADNWSRREAMVVALSRWEEATRGVKGLKVMAVVAAQLLRRCQVLWPDIEAESIPGWPAFTQTSLQNKPAVQREDKSAEQFAKRVIREAKAME